MPATYPLAVRTFTQKRNLLDDVDASHVNDIQDEIKAIQTTLGVLPAVDKVSGTAYPSVDKRLEVMASGTSQDFFFLTQKNNMDIPTFAVGDEDTGVGVPLVAGYDSAGLANGLGVKIKKTGYYDLKGSAVFVDNSLIGRRILNLMVAGPTGSYTRWHFADAHHDTTPGMSQGMVQFAYTARLYAGYRVALSAAIGNHGLASGKVPLRYARLSGLLLRSL